MKSIHIYGDKAYFDNGKEMGAFTKVQYYILKLSAKGMSDDNILLTILPNAESLPWEVKEQALNHIALFCKNCADRNIRWEEKIETGEWGLYYPKTLNIELTNKCNFACSHCYKEAQSDNTDSISKEIVIQLLNGLIKKVRIIHLTGGEPLIWGGLYDILMQYGHQYLFNITTNGYLLDMYSDEALKMVNNIQISLYGKNEDEYRLVTSKQGMAKRVFENIERLRDNNIPFSIGINLNSLVCKGIDDYLCLLEQLNPSKVIFSEVGQTGRGKNNSFWNLSEEEKENMRKYIATNLAIPSNFSKDVYADAVEEKTIDSCSAGRMQLTVSEKGDLLYCNILDHSFFNIGRYGMITEYVKSEFDKELFMRKIETYCKSNDCKGHLCPLLEERA